MRIVLVLSLMAVFAVAVLGQPPARPPITFSPVVDVKGTIAKVQIAMGQGMPYLDVKTADGNTKVFLGSIRYLMEQNFNPKAGQEVVVKGYKLNADVVAITVKLPEENKELQLRDKDGRPVWMGGPRGRWSR